MKAFLFTALLALSQDRAPSTSQLQELWDSGRRVEAVDSLTQKFERAPQDRELGAQLIEWEIVTHRYQSAWAHLESQGPEANATRGKVLYLLGRYEDALEFLEGRNPDNCLARLDALSALGREDELIKALGQASAVLGADHPKVLTASGQMHARAGEFEIAEKAFRAALNSDPLEQAARFGLGRALIAQAKQDEGLAILAEHRRLIPLIDRREFALKSLDLAPAHAPNQADVGDCERALGRTAEALTAYRVAVRFAKPEELASISLRLARLYFEDLRDVKQALEVLDQSYKVARDPRLLVRAGDYARDSDDLETAEQRYREALQLRPNDRAILQRLNRVLNTRKAGE